jgi:hypothetical protein
LATAQNRGRRPYKYGMEEWRKLCEQAARERDPEKLMALTQRITELLHMKCETLKRHKLDSREDQTPEDSIDDSA